MSGFQIKTVVPQEVNHQFMLVSRPFWPNTMQNAVNMLFFPPTSSSHIPKPPSACTRDTEALWLGDPHKTFVALKPCLQVAEDCFKAGHFGGPVSSGNVSAIELIEYPLISNSSKLLL